MKKIIKILGVFIMSVLIFSCSKSSLDKVPLDAYTSELIWSNSDLAEGVLKDLYWEGLRSTYVRWGGRDECLETDTWTDNILNKQDNAVALEAYSPASLDSRIGNYNQYGNIRKASLIIDKLSSGEAFKDDEPKRKQLIAEARCLRAMIYIWMARRWGGLMLVKHAMSPTDDFNLPRSSEDETYNFIIEDLKAAIPDLPAAGSKERFTKGAALTLLLRAAVDGQKWDEAIAAGDILFSGSAGTWSLDPNYRQMFGSFDYPASSPEIMFYLTVGPNKTVADNLLAFYIGCPTPPGRNTKGPAFVLSTDCWSQAYPSQEIVNDYLVIDAVDGLAKRYNKTSQWLQAGADTTSSLMYAPTRDARFEQTIVHDSTYYFTNFIVTNQNGNVYWANTQDHPWMTKSGYIWRKWVDEDPNRRPVYQTYYSYRYTLLRLGEACLNYAEALARKGRITDAVRAMNKTRVTHGKLPPLSESVSATEFWKWYKIERRVELVLEGDRYFSLIRYARIENATTIPELNRRTHAIDIRPDGTYTFTDNNGYGTNYNFSWPRRKHFPIPESEFINNPNLGKQNEGW